MQTADRLKSYVVYFLHGKEVWDSDFPPRLSKGSGVEICCLWYKTKTTVFAFSFHRGIKTQWPLAIVRTTVLFALQLFIILSIITLELGALEQEDNDRVSTLKQFSNSA